MISLVENRIEEVRQICHRHGVERLDLFGSAAGEAFAEALRERTPSKLSRKLAAREPRG